MKNTQELCARKWLVRTAQAYLGTPYRWGGDDPSGFDCSGLVVECLKTVGLLGEDEDLTADGLWRRFSENERMSPRVGALIFRLDREAGRAVHVGICVDRWFMIEAGGGGESVRDETTAWQTNAYVRVRPLPRRLTDYVILDPLVEIGAKRSSHPK